MTDAWKSYEDEQIRKSFASRETDPNFPILVEQAKARGYEPAPLNSLLATGNEAELYTWKGRVWVKSRMPSN